jgi:1,2-diacylglycerol 3-beta-glucosyltransferase
VTIILALAATAAIIVCFTYALGMYLEGRSDNDELHADASDLFFVFLIPCLNEDRVIGATLDRLHAITSLNSLILVVDDGSDDQTAAVVQSRVNERIILLRRELPEARQGKGAALNAALDFLASRKVLQGRSSQDVIICLMDADGRLDPDAPGVIGYYFQDPGVGAVQVAVRIENRYDGLLPRLQDMEFVCYSELFQRCRSHHRFAGLGGNGQFTRLSALQSLGPWPWSPSTLTEDLDLGVRLVLAGWRTLYTNATEVHQQGLSSIKALVRQRSRWFQGLLQCWHLVPRVARESSGRVRLDLLHMLLTPVLIFAAFLMTLSFIVAPIERLLNPNLDAGRLGLNSLVAWYVLTFFPAALFAIAYRRIAGIGRSRSLALGHAFVLYGLLWIASGSLAAWRTLTRRRGWLKTDRLNEQAHSQAVTAIWNRGREADAQPDWNLDWKATSKESANG